MSGRRRSNATTAGVEVPPTMRRSRPDRRRQQLAVRFASATTEVERLVCAFDYCRGAASRRHPNPERAAQIITAAIEHLITAGDQLLHLQARETARPRKDTA